VRYSRWVLSLLFLAVTLAQAPEGLRSSGVRDPNLPFQLAAGLVDGLVITAEPDRALALWSLLLDHGHRLAPLPGPGATRDNFVVSTGPGLAVTREGSSLKVKVWGDDLQRIELWSHNRVILTKSAADQDIAWTPTNPQDWVAVRLVAKNGWAISPAFTDMTSPAPLMSDVKLVFPEISSQQQAGGRASIWDGEKLLREIDMERNELAVTVPVQATIRIEMGDGRRVDVRPFIASGVRTMLRELPPDALLDWATYEEVRRRLRRIAIESHF